MTEKNECPCPCHDSGSEMAGHDSSECPDCSQEHNAIDPMEVMSRPQHIIEEISTERERQASADDLRSMTRPQKLILATKADRVIRAMLIRDTDPQVIFYLCKNPKITLDEILEITRLGTMNGPIANLIAGTAHWIQSEQVRLNLVQNPKTPTPTALKLLSGLNIKNLRSLAKNWNIRSQIKQAALKLVLERGG